MKRKLRSRARRDFMQESLFSKHIHDILRRMPFYSLIQKGKAHWLRSNSSHSDVRSVFLKLWLLRHTYDTLDPILEFLHCFCVLQGFQILYQPQFYIQEKIKAWDASASSSHWLPPWIFSISHPLNSLKSLSSEEREEVSLPSTRALQAHNTLRNLPPQTLPPHPPLLHFMIPATQTQFCIFTS